MIARVNAQVVEAQERAERAKALRVEVDAVRGTATSPRREVEVSVDASGKLTGLSLTDAAYDLRAADLSALIVRTAQAAQRDAGEKVLRLSSDAFGEDSPVTQRLAAEVADRQTPDPAAGLIR